MSRQQKGSSMSKTRPSQRFHSLNAEQVEILDEVLSEVVPIHGRGNFPTLELRPRDIITAVRARLETQGITVRDVRLNGSMASHVLVRDNGTSYKDLDIIFGVELPRQEDFQVIKESVLGCLLDCLPAGVNRERISSATMKEAYVQKMVKVFNEHDRWSLISLSNNSGKNLELKFVSALRRQFEFSVDSFQIILDRLLESYLQQEAQQQLDTVQDQAVDSRSKDRPSLPENPKAPETEVLESTGTDLASSERAGTNHVQHHDEIQESDRTPPQTEHSQQTAQSNSSIKQEENKNETDPKQKTKPTEPQELSDPAKLSEQLELSEQTSLSHSLEKTPRSDETEPPKHVERLEQTGSPSVQVEHLEQAQLVNDENKEPHQSQNSDEKESLNQIELPIQAETSNQTEPPIEREEHLKQLECSNQEENSNPSHAEPGLDPVVLVNEIGSDNADFPECFSEDQSSDEEDQTHSLSVSYAHTQIDKHFVNETNIETASGQLTEVMSENDGEHVSETEGNDRDEKLATDDSSSTTSLSIAPITQCELEAQSSLQSDDTEHMPKALETMTPPETQHMTLQSDVTQDMPNTLETVTSPETQHMTPTRSSLASDKKASSLMTAKVANRLSQMVVLKHSSPKPPRRMCRKAHVTPLNPNPVSESDPVVAATSPDPTPEPSPELETASNPEASVMSTDSTTSIADSTSSTMSVCATKINPSTSPGSNQTLNLDPTSAPDLSPDPSPVASTEPSLVSTQDPTASQLSTEVLSEADPTQGLTEIVRTQLACDEECHFESSPAASGEPASQLELSEPSDSPATPAPHGNMCHTDDREPSHTSEGELSDEEEEEVRGQSLTVAIPSAQQESHRSTPPLHSVTLPIRGLSPHRPCFIPSSPSLSPPQCLTPPSGCLTPPMLSVSPPPSFSSPLLSFSPTSSCLSSPPYLTPPMLSLSPPPSCLSPPLLCLTPPVGTEDLIPQVSLDLEPLMQNTESEGQIVPSSSLSAVSLCPSQADTEEQDIISLSPQVPETVLFPSTASSPTVGAPPRSQPLEANDSAPNVAPAVPISVPENQEAATVSADMAEQKNPSRGSRSVPAVEVLAESMYGDFEAAMDHLRYRLIATRNPEEIRGGGLLKYSNLLVRDYRPASETQIKTLERYMCSRFFIDFPDVQEQQRKILSYLKNHFIGEERSKYQYLMTLRRVVDDSTVCLMGHERRQTLNMITVLALKVLGEQNIIPNTDHVTCFYQPAPYLAEHTAPYLAEPSYCSYYVPQGGSTLLYQPYPLHLHTQTGLV